MAIITGDALLVDEEALLKDVVPPLWNFQGFGVYGIGLLVGFDLNGTGYSDVNMSLEVAKIAVEF
jgi:hypothetical protein